MTNYWKWLPWLSSNRSGSVNNTNVIPLTEKEVMRYARDKSVTIDEYKPFYAGYVRYMTTQILRDVRQEMELDSYGGNYENVEYNEQGAAWYEVRVSHILPRELKESVKEAIGKMGWFCDVLNVPNPTDASEIETRIKIYLTVGELVR